MESHMYHTQYIDTISNYYAIITMWPLFAEVLYGVSWLEYMNVKLSCLGSSHSQKFSFLLFLDFYCYKLYILF